MGYALLGQPVIYSNHCPLAGMGWLVIGEEMAHWLAGARQKNVTALCAEMAAQRRQKEAKLNTSNSHRHDHSSACSKSFNLTTYKLHALGDYARTICLFGTTDSYTTQIVSQFCF